MVLWACCAMKQYYCIGQQNFCNIRFEIIKIYIQIDDINRNIGIILNENMVVLLILFHIVQNKLKMILKRP